MIEVYKGYQVKPHKQYPTSYIVAVDGKGGGIPDILDTLFTSRGIAKSSIDDYLLRKSATKDKANASKARTTSRDK